MTKRSGNPAPTVTLAGYVSASDQDLRVRYVIGTQGYVTQKHVSPSIYAKLKGMSKHKRNYDMIKRLERFDPIRNTQATDLGRIIAQAKRRKNEDTVKELSTEQRRKAVDGIKSALRAARINRTVAVKVIRKSIYITPPLNRPAGYSKDRQHLRQVASVIINAGFQVEMASSPLNYIFKVTSIPDSMEEKIMSKENPDSVSKALYESRGKKIASGGLIEMGGADHADKKDAKKKKKKKSIEAAKEAFRQTRYGNRMAEETDDVYEAVLKEAKDIMRSTQQFKGAPLGKRTKAMNAVMAAVKKKDYVKAWNILYKARADNVFSKDEINRISQYLEIPKKRQLTKA